MTDLTDFLLARIADDERAADEADMATWEQEEPVRADLGPLSPDRLRRECKVKRAIVAACTWEQPIKVTVRPGVHEWRTMLTVSDDDVTADDVLRALASLYAGHEDYRQEWKP